MRERKTTAEKFKWLKKSCNVVRSKAKNTRRTRNEKSHLQHQCSPTTTNHIVNDSYQQCEAFWRHALPRYQGYDVPACKVTVSGTFLMIGSIILRQLHHRILHRSLTNSFERYMPAQTAGFDVERRMHVSRQYRVALTSRGDVAC